MQNFYEQFFYGAPLVAASEMYEYITYMLDLLKDSNNCFLLSLIEKHPNEPIIIYHNFSFLTEKSFGNLSSLLHNLTNVLNLFLFISTFLVFLNDYFFQMACLQVSYHHIFIVNKLHYVILQYFFCIQLFPMFFMVLVFQGQSPGSGSRF